MPIRQKYLIPAVIFFFLAIFLFYQVPTIEIAWVSALLLLTIYLFAFEVVEVDVAAISIMVILGLSSLFAPWMGLKEGLVNSEQLFVGFSSNAVISIIAVMIIGAGLDKTGLMSKVAGFILKIGGTSETRIIPIISSAVGVISSFMQNVGATALFLPVVARISARAKLPMSRLLMPMGFCAILGGTVTMVGSSPLILLNELIDTSNAALPADQQMAPWPFFSVTPIGLVLVTTGIFYFVLFGRYVLPSTVGDKGTTSENVMDYFHKLYGVSDAPTELYIPSESDLVGKRFDDMETTYRIRVIGIHPPDEENHVGPGMLDRDIVLKGGARIAILAAEADLEAFVKKFQLIKHAELQSFSESLAATKAGIAEVVIPPSSQLVGKSARDVWLRKTYGLGMIALHRNGETLRKGDHIRDMPFCTGDTLVAHTTWAGLARLEKDPNFVVVTTEFPHDELRPNKVGWATLFFVIALSLVLFSNVLLSIALLTGAIGMILSGVLKIDEAYQAVSWKTVFLLASLIPLGMAVEQTGTAKWIADQTLSVVGDMPIWVIQAALAVLATFFTLVMSNVGATVLLVPLAVNIALGVGADPAIFALTVAIATSNSFLIPTHQVNALIMGPGGYRVVDFMRAGLGMTVLFLIMMIVMMNVIF